MNGMEQSLGLACALLALGLLVLWGRLRYRTRRPASPLRRDRSAYAATRRSIACERIAMARSAAETSQAQHWARAWHAAAIAGPRHGTRG